MQFVIYKRFQFNQGEQRISARQISHVNPFNKPILCAISPQHYIITHAYIALTRSFAIRHKIVGLPDFNSITISSYNEQCAACALSALSARSFIAIPSHPISFHVKCALALNVCGEFLGDIFVYSS